MKHPKMCELHNPFLVPYVIINELVNNGHLQTEKNAISEHSMIVKTFSKHYSDEFVSVLHGPR